jgi:hypothetical protein
VVGLFSSASTAIIPPGRQEGLTDRNKEVAVIKKAARRVFHLFGLRVSRLSSLPAWERPGGESPWRDLGRTYTDPPGTFPNFRLRPATPRPYADAPTIFRVDNGTGAIEEEVFYSHLTLLKLLKHHAFDTVLDIGSHAQRVTRLFRHVGKKVTTVEVAPGYEADYKDDYLAIAFPAPFDAIWCSQTLEHQRNVGLFLDKVFDDLRDGGVLALTVPYDLTTNLCFGHCNGFSPLVLLYHLVLAGFDCSNARVKCYNGNIGVVVEKRYNGIRRRTSFARLPGGPKTHEGMTDLAGKWMTARDLLGDELFENMAAAFPFPVTGNHLTWSGRSINWGDPI